MGGGGRKPKLKDVEEAVIEEITFSEVCELLCNIALEYAGKPIRLILDNATYQKCYIVADTAALLGIELVYIPSYSPNLNLIERLWKFVKSELRTKYYDNFDIFMQRTDSIIRSTDKGNKKRIDSLITDKVQLFDEFSSYCDTFSDNVNLRAKSVA